MRILRSATGEASRRFQHRAFRHWVIAITVHITDLITHQTYFDSQTDLSVSFLVQTLAAFFFAGGLHLLFPVYSWLIFNIWPRKVIFVKICKYFHLGGFKVASWSLVFSNLLRKYGSLFGLNGSLMNYLPFECELPGWLISGSWNLISISDVMD